MMEATNASMPAVPMVSLMQHCDAAMAFANTRWWVEPLVATLAFAIFMKGFRMWEPGFWSGPEAWWLWRQAGPIQRSTMLALLTYWVGVRLFVEIVPPVASVTTGCPHNLSNVLHLWTELAAGIVAYDWLFFWVHLAMHMCPATIGRLTRHARHHALNHASTFRTVHHSFVDGSLQVLINILVQRCTPWGAAKSRFARMLHNIVVIFMLVESHASAPGPRLFRRLCGGVRGHHEHHETGGPPFQQFFSYLDWLLAHGYLRRLGMPPLPAALPAIKEM